MSKKRLHKSSDAIISGVCGGIAEYFGIDPTLVRILTLVLTIVGLGFPLILYLICMIVFPPDPGLEQGYVDARAEAKPAPCQRVYASVCTDAANAKVPSSTPGANASDQPPPPDPKTRVSMRGRVNKGSAQAVYDGDSYSGSTKKRWSGALVLGAVLVGVGIIALLCNFIHVSLWRFWPLIVVAVGLVSLFTPGPRGWSLERAGNAIVLITIGFALLAWMLQLVPTGAFILAFWELWPVLLIVAGLAVIGGARKSNVFMLASSLLLSATIIFGLLFYADVDWANLGAMTFFFENDGIGEFFTTISLEQGLP